jgi:hypothetical protein
MTRFVQLCSQMEGFGKPNALPTKDHNPMDLRHSPHSSHAGEGPNGIGEIDSDVHGFADAERQARIWAERGLTLQQAIEEQTGWTPPTPANPTGEVDGNDTANYLAVVVHGFNGAVTADTPMTEVLTIPSLA